MGGWTAGTYAWPSDALVKGRGRRHSCTGCTISFAAKLRRKLRAQVCLPMSRQHLFARCPADTYFFKREKVGKKRFFRLPSRGKRNYPSAISTPRLKLSNNTPAGRPRTFAPDRSAIFMGHSVYALSGGDRPADAGMLSVNWQRPPKAGGRKAQDCGRERACNLAPKAQPVAPGEERVIHSSRPPEVT